MPDDMPVSHRHTCEPPQPTPARPPKASGQNIRERNAVKHGQKKEKKWSSAVKRKVVSIRERKKVKRKPKNQPPQPHPARPRWRNMIERCAVKLNDPAQTRAPVCVRASVRASERACVRACVRVCARAVCARTPEGTSMPFSVVKQLMPRSCACV